MTRVLATEERRWSKQTGAHAGPFTNLFGLETLARNGVAFPLLGGEEQMGQLTMEEKLDKREAVAIVAKVFEQG